VPGCNRIPYTCADDRIEPVDGAGPRDGPTAHQIKVAMSMDRATSNERSASWCKWRALPRMSGASGPERDLIGGALLDDGHLEGQVERLPDGSSEPPAWGAGPDVAAPDTDCFRSGRRKGRMGRCRPRNHP
jgi:hypothetical protein